MPGSTKLNRSSSNAWNTSPVIGSTGPTHLKVNGPAVAMPWSGSAVTSIEPKPPGQMHWVEVISMVALACNVTKERIRSMVFFFMANFIIGGVIIN